MKRAYYSDRISTFVGRNEDEIIGNLVKSSHFDIGSFQRDAWIFQVRLLQGVLAPHQGSVYFEFDIPRLGKRIDVVAIIGPVIFVMEFKVGEAAFAAHALDQVFDYALDLKNFHEPSHDAWVAPILISTAATIEQPRLQTTSRTERLFVPIKSTTKSLSDVLHSVLTEVAGATIDSSAWERGRYCPTPTIIEAATALYGGHTVAEISRTDGGAINLSCTSDKVDAIIHESKARLQKAICFVTGVPGAGKTLVGLDVATRHLSQADDLYSVFLSGNGPLVAVLREALARDKVGREWIAGRKLKLGAARSEVKAFIQNVHHFRDDCLMNVRQPPIEHVVLFDEAQRAWDRDQTMRFMRLKKNKPNFNQSEPEFLISCLDRHSDWAVIVCLVGGGQEINTGEAGIGEWIDSVQRSFPHWQLYLSPRLTDSEFGAARRFTQMSGRSRVTFCDELHLGVSMRSFRAEHVSSFVKQVLDLEEVSASETFRRISDQYPIVVTRDLREAKRWVRTQARGSERYGIVASSQAQRLKPHAIDVRSPIDPVHWFLDGKEDVRSSYYLEDVATEFHVQGLEVDWACVTWDADFRYTPEGWQHWSFCGDRWRNIRKPERQMYLKNAYRVLLTRARPGMVVFVPEGDCEDPTRRREYYDATYDYLTRIGLPRL